MNRKQVQAVLHDYKWFMWYICVMLTIIVVMLAVQISRSA